MFDCRYYDLCCFTDDGCNGEPECPKRGYCQFYSPMPDVKALLALADEMEEFGNLPVKHPGVCVLHNEDFSRELGYARRIREILGE